jgi:glycolate oxidase FAD binding subunit
MNTMDEHLQVIAATVGDAAAVPLCIVGGGSKDFYGRSVTGQTLAVGAYRGVVSYEPTELVITARAGTRLAEVEAVLRDHGQMLAFEPPHFGMAATLGGTIACGLSGPRRPYAGAARDFVLGVRMMDGQARVLTFGGRVMKNVAGYDVARLMTGALGTLGILLEISLKVLPLPEIEATVRMEMTQFAAIERMNRLAGAAVPLSAAAWVAGTLWLRWSGSAPAVQAACRSVGGDLVQEGDDLWRDLREHALPFFAGEAPLWRLSVPPACSPLMLDGEWLLDWGGAQRWLRGNLPASIVQRTARDAGCHAVLFRGGDRTGDVFTPLDPVSACLHARLRSAFDPRGILNRGRMYGGS